MMRPLLTTRYVLSMRLKLALVVTGLALAITACFPDQGGSPTPTTVSTTAAPTTTSTTTTTAPLPTLTYTGTADKTAGCYSGLLGDDTFEQSLGTDGWWHFGFQGCTLFSTETVALIDPAGGPTGDAFQSPTGYQCRFEIVGTSDATGYVTNQIGNVADTGGLIFLESSSSWSSPTTWKITCIQA